MKWSEIRDAAMLDEIRKESIRQKVLIFKHSIHCGVSASVLSELENVWQDEEMQGLKPYFLDLIRYRSISNQIAEDFGVVHQSPQVIVIESGRAIYNSAHFGISYQELRNLAQSAT
ncbi:MAG: bacillithiol system redox-active protein YtxJ [Bacteroidia bacterium]|nr:bacillithiol system redox-active protein YtxJ [Bacteroidia bacterium]